jgi:tetratricopeptide (TPR) repeat protein
MREPEGAAEEMLREAKAAIEAREAAGDDEVLARAWRLMADAHNVMGRMSEYASALDRAAGYARRAGDVRLEASYVIWKAPYFVFGPGRVEEALRFVEEDLEPLQRVPGVMSFALHVRAHMRARVGEFDGAVEDMVEFRRGLRELGRDREYAVTAGCFWDVCFWAGDWKRGEEALREGYEMLERMGNKGFLSEIALDLGDAVLRQGMLDEAERLSEIGEEVTAEDDVFGVTRSLTLRARVKAASGDLGEAESSARRAVELRTDNEFLEVAAEARLALAEAFRLQGKPEALSMAAEALELFERKGNVIAATRVREFIDAKPG